MGVAQHFELVWAALCFEALTPTDKAFAKPAAVAVQRVDTHVCFVLDVVGLENKAHDAAGKAALE